MQIKRVIPSSSSLALGFVLVVPSSLADEREAPHAQFVPIERLDVPSTRGFKDVHFGSGHADDDPLRVESEGGDDAVVCAHLRREKPTGTTEPG